jgi:DNA-directed RNA polymerase specialized sigma24 family protein
LQDVFYELVEANRLLMPIEHVTGWLFRVARNRITDLFRKKRPESFSDTAVADEDGELLQLEDLLLDPSSPDIADHLDKLISVQVVHQAHAHGHVGSRQSLPHGVQLENREQRRARTANAPVGSRSPRPQPASVLGPTEAGDRPPSA